MKFRDHKYTWQRPFEQTRHQWQLRGPDGGIHFHVSLWEDNPEKHEQFGGPSAGLEFHHSKQPGGEPEAAHHSPCWLTGQPCWHDGASLYAMETIWPIVEPMLRSGNHSDIFRLLEGEYNRHFERLAEDAA